jgi:hypothetical protein
MSLGMSSVGSLMQLLNLEQANDDALFNTNDEYVSMLMIDSVAEDVDVYVAGEISLIDENAKFHFMMVICLVLHVSKWCK